MKSHPFGLHPRAGFGVHVPLFLPRLLKQFAIRTLSCQNFVLMQRLENVTIKELQ